MSSINFASPAFFALFSLLIPYIIWYIFQWQKSRAAINIPGEHTLAQVPRTYKHYLAHMPFVLRLVAISALIIALARPQSSDNWSETSTEGIDIMISLDVSTSMLAQDFDPNRLNAARKLASEFIAGRPHDRMGLVIFAGESFTQCPLTTDHAVLLNMFQEVKAGLLDDGTAIGLGLGTAVTRLKDSDSKSKVIILLTDGVNNTGEITPQTAADLAALEHIRVYTIGVGTQGKAKYPIQTPFGIDYQMIDVEIDEGVLQDIAQKTGGQYFRATDNERLKEIYHEIDQLEKTKMRSKEFSRKHEEYFLFALAALIAILLEVLLRNTLLRSVL